MLQRFPDRVDAWRLCDHEETIEGRIPLNLFTRLTPLLTSAEGEAAFVLKFSRDAANRALVLGNIQATLPVTCQRCLETVELDAKQEIRLALVRGEEEAKRLPADLEPVILSNGMLLEIADLVEDELLLAIPHVPMHRPGQCELFKLADEPSPVNEPAEQDNPFAALKDVKFNKTDN